MLLPLAVILFSIAIVSFVVFFVCYAVIDVELSIGITGLMLYSSEDHQRRTRKIRAFGYVRNMSLFIGAISACLAFVFWIALTI